MNIWELFFLSPLVNGLLVFYKLTGNLGLAIIALTVAMKLVMFPLTMPSMRAMQRMKELAPELEKLKKRHAGDKTKLMQAQADLYKQHGVNPASGCLPQILQLVILFALVGVFGMLSNANPTEEINKFAYSGLKLSENLHTSFLYLDLAKPDVIHLPSLPFPLPGPLLIVSAIIQFLSALLMMPAVKKAENQAKKTESATDDFAATFQKQSLYMFPVLTLFFGISFASGLVLYWTFLSLTQAVQQYYASGWGGLTPWLRKVNLLKSQA